MVVLLFAMTFLLRSRKPHLPTGLLDCSPDTGNSSQAVTDTGTAGHHDPLAAEQLAPAQLTENIWNMRHHDLVLERNEDIEDKLWSAMSERYMPPPPLKGHNGDTMTSILGTPVLIEQNQSSKPTTAFLSPRHGITPQQRAAAERFQAAVTARARNMKRTERDARATAF